MAWTGSSAEGKVLETAWKQRHAEGRGELEGW